MALPLHEKATAMSASHEVQRTRAKPSAALPHSNAR
jgi:hypothetical protein